MMPHRTFDMEVLRSISPNGLRWPKPNEAANERNLGCNRSYVDLRGCSWSQFDRIFEFESQFIARLVSAGNQEQEYNAIADELCEDDEGLLGLDIGVASAVVALSTAGCIPFSSCNGAAFGGSHHEEHPLVAFFSRPQFVSVLMQTAEEANTGVENDTSGALVLYANDIRNMLHFAKALKKRCTAQTIVP
jgi:hypothetical protein